MQTVSYSEARADLAAVMDKASADRAPILITSDDGKNVVLISSGEWARIEEALAG